MLINHMWLKILLFINLLSAIFYFLGWGVDFTAIDQLETGEVEKIFRYNFKDPFDDRQLYSSVTQETFSRGSGIFPFLESGNDISNGIDFRLQVIKIDSFIIDYMKISSGDDFYIVKECNIKIRQIDDRTFAYYHDFKKTKDWDQVCKTVLTLEKCAIHADIGECDIEEYKLIVNPLLPESHLFHGVCEKNY